MMEAETIWYFSLSKFRYFSFSFRSLPRCCWFDGVAFPEPISHANQSLINLTTFPRQLLSRDAIGRTPIASLGLILGLFILCFLLLFNLFGAVSFFSPVNGSSFAHIFVNQSGAARTSRVFSCGLSSANWARPLGIFWWPIKLSLSLSFVDFVDLVGTST